MSDDRAAIPVTLPGPSWARHNAICLDTATSMASVALVEQGIVVAETAWRAGMAHSRQLTTCLRGLAASAGFDVRSADLIAVCTGPGSFNGVRAGISTALGLAVGLGIPVYGTSSLDLLAFPHADRAPAQRAVLPAGRGEYYTALFGTRGGRWRRLSGYIISDLETLAAESPAKCLWCGILDEAEMERLAALLGGSRRMAPPAHNVRRAAYLLPLALAAAAAGAPATPEAVQPLYLRRPAITSPRSSPPAPLPIREGRTPA